MMAAMSDQDAEQRKEEEAKKLVEHVQCPNGHIRRLWFEEGQIQFCCAGYKAKVEPILRARGLLRWR